MVRGIEVLVLQSESLDQIYAHAKAEFPEECCGIILSDGAREFVRKCRNVQNERHAEAPEMYPRDARTAYLIDPNDLIRVHKEAETENQPIKAFYHSHPNHDAYFSEKDKADAMAWDEPMYPDAAYIVVSIYTNVFHAFFARLRHVACLLLPYPFGKHALTKSSGERIRYLSASGLRSLSSCTTAKAFAWSEADTDFVEVPIHAKRDA